jgi:hypothetical protein
MDQTDLRSLYLSTLSHTPTLRTALRRAAKTPPHQMTLSLTRFKDNPFLLYACCGYAGLEGVTLTFVPAKSDA